MRHISLLLLFILVMCISGVAYAASCERCYESIAGDKKFCTECELSLSNRLTDMKSREDSIVHTITSTREEYKNALEELIQYYMDIGNHSRLKKARKELKALNKVPVNKYLTASEEITEIIPFKNIEDANILFQDGKTYAKSHNIVNRKAKLKSAEARFKKIIDDYPKSDKVDDAAYELATIYESRYFKDYEAAAFYYVKCYKLNDKTDKPARFKAAQIYDKHLKDYKKAIKNYRKALKHNKDEAYRFTAKTRLEQLEQEGQ